MYERLPENARRKNGMKKGGCASPGPAKSSRPVFGPPELVRHLQRWQTLAGRRRAYSSLTGRRRCARCTDWCVLGGCYCNRLRLRGDANARLVAGRQRFDVHLICCRSIRPRSESRQKDGDADERKDDGTEYEWTELWHFSFPLLRSLSCWTMDMNRPEEAAEFLRTSTLYSESGRETKLRTLRLDGGLGVLSPQSFVHCHIN